MPAKITDYHWFAYVDQTDTGFVFRYFRANRHILSDMYIKMVLEGRELNSPYMNTAGLYTLLRVTIIRWILMNGVFISSGE